MNVKHGIRLVLTAVVGVLPATRASAQKPAANEQTNPYRQADETRISISGTAVNCEPDGFTLDYGAGTVLVEMDDRDWYDESRFVLDGDAVTVYGLIDDGFYERTSIEAGRVYIERLGTFFYASSADEERNDFLYNWIAAAPLVPGQTIVRGAVTGISGRTFTLDTGRRKITVDTSGLVENPLDDIGGQKIGLGDYVSASGSMDETFWSRHTLRATRVITLWDE